MKTAQNPHCRLCTYVLSRFQPEFQADAKRQLWLFRASLSAIEAQKCTFLYIFERLYRLTSALTA